MSSISRVDILARAKALCEKDGHSWDVVVRTPTGRHAPLERASISESIREDYLRDAEMALRRERQETPDA